MEGAGAGSGVGTAISDCRIVLAWARQDGWDWRPGIGDWKTAGPGKCDFGRVVWCNKYLPYPNIVSRQNGSKRRESREVLDT